MRNYLKLLRRNMIFAQTPDPNPFGDPPNLFPVTVIAIDTDDADERQDRLLRYFNALPLSSYTYSLTDWDDHDVWLELNKQKVVQLFSDMIDIALNPNSDFIVTQYYLSGVLPGPDEFQNTPPLTLPWTEGESPRDVWSHGH